MVYPTARHDRMKYWFWHAYTPFHPYVRNVSYRLGIGQIIAERVVPEMAETGRQNFLLGTLHPERSMQDFVAFLISQGFGNHFVAWEDEDELVSLRRPTDFAHQYHLRIFRDGEVRGHFEYTPECHTLLHLIRVGFEGRISEFEELLQDWIVPTRD